MKFEFPPPEAPPISGSDDVVATGGYAAWSHSDRWGQIPHVEDWRGYGGDSSDTGTLLSAIAAAKAAGGMRLRVAPQSYDVEETLLIDGPHIHLFGQGAGWFGKNDTLLTSPKTRFLWGGAAGGTIVHFATPDGSITRLRGGGMFGIQLDGNAFLAARGLFLESWVRGVFEEITVVACSESHFRLGIIQGNMADASTPVDVSYNHFSRCLASTVSTGGGLYTTSLAIGWHITGGRPASLGDTCLNTFWDCHAYMSKGLGWKLERCDTNSFHYCGGGAAFDGAQYGWELGSSDQDSATTPFGGPGSARHNSFFGLVGAIHSRASQTTGGIPADSNIVWGNARSNNVPRPVLEPEGGGTAKTEIYFWDTDGSSRTKYIGVMEDVNVPPDVGQGLSQIFIDTALGPLLLKDSDNNIRTIVDSGIITTWTPTFEFTTPGDSVITYATQSGHCMRCGHFILIQMDLRFSLNAYTTAAGTARITGLPYPASFGGAFQASYMDRLTFTTAQEIRFNIGNSADYIQPMIATSAAAMTNAGIAVFPAGTANIRIIGTGMYWAA